MAGKSWMSGLMPYRDFADSKGPLLWLIYGLGYLVSPHNTYGVFVIETLFYAATFYWLYKIALIFTKNSPQALASSLLMACLYFYPGMHLEIKAEDFCQLFQVWGLYALIKFVYLKQPDKKTALLLGISCGCTLLIKYSYCLTLWVVTAGILVFLIKEKKFVSNFMLCFLSGFCFTILPFFLYFILTGTLKDFLNEYFINTGSTIINVKTNIDNSIQGFYKKWPFIAIKYFLRASAFGAYMRILLIGLLLSIYFFKKSKWTLSILLVWYILSLLLLSVTRGDHYFITMAIFAYGGIILIISKIPFRSHFSSLIFGSCILGVLVIVNTNYNESGFKDLTYNRIALQEHKKVADIINKRELELGRRPTIVFYEGWDSGETIETNAIAGAKYWCKQVGMTPAMLKRHLEDPIKDKPDFIVVYEHNKDIQKKLKEIGYESVLRYHPRPEPEINNPDVCLLYML